MPVVRLLHDENTPQRVLICGSRDWTDEEPIAIFLAALPEGSVIIQGGCRGADQIAAKIARYLGFEVKTYEADWSTFEKAAGPIRNRFMMSDSDPTIAAAFHDDLEHSKGTLDMVQVLVMSNVPTYLITTDLEGDYIALG